MAKEDLDLDLKLRMRRIFWKMGCFCPLETVVSAWEYESQKRHDITDIDVLGISFSSDLRKTVLMADCKSGQETAGRLLWLRGAMDLFGSSAGYFVKKELHPNTRAIASKLNITTLDQNDLALLEKQVEVSQVSAIISDPSIYNLQQDLWGIEVPKNAKPTAEQLALKKIYQYYNYNYWFIEPNRNIMTTIENLISINKQLKAGDKRSELLFYRIAALFTISLLHAGHDVLSKNLSDVSSFARQYIFGGTLALRERERFFELLRRYTKEELTLEPKYFPQLLELINTVIRYSGHSYQCPRYIDLAILQILKNIPIDFKTIFGTSYDEGTVKIVKDILLFLVDKCELDKSLVAELLLQ